MRPLSKTFRAIGIVLKRSNVGEADRVVSLLTKEFGKLVCVAKGVRKLASSRRATLEPGNYIQAYLVRTKSLPLLTQAKLLEDCRQIRDSLPDIRKLTQLLEIIDKLFVEEELEEELFQTIIDLRRQIVTKKAANGLIKNSLGKLIEQLGYRHPQEAGHASILDYVAVLADKPMKSFSYLSVKK